MSPVKHDVVLSNGYSPTFVMCSTTGESGRLQSMTLKLGLGFTQGHGGATLPLSNNNNNNNRGKPIAWDVTVPDTYAESHVSSTAVTPGAAANRAALSKMDKYTKLASTHIFCQFAIQTAGAWHETAIEVTQEIGRRITVVTEDTRETEFLFQRLSMALQRGNAVSFQNTMITE